MKKGMRERGLVVVMCRCGANREDSYHFFFDCSHYSNIRHTLFENLNWLSNYCALDLTNRISKKKQHIEAGLK
jgi:hypothetical protein